MNLKVLLLAISLVESGGDSQAIGRHHERGAHQLSPRVHASYAGTEEERAMQHLQFLAGELKRRRVFVCPTNLAIAWNAGINATTQGRAPVKSYQYAGRVINLYNQRIK